MKGPTAPWTSLTPIAWLAVPFATIHPATLLFAHVHRHTFAAWLAASRKEWDRGVFSWHDLELTTALPLVLGNGRIVSAVVAVLSPTLWAWTLIGPSLLVGASVSDA